MPSTGYAILTTTSGPIPGRTHECGTSYLSVPYAAPPCRWRSVHRAARVYGSFLRHAETAAERYSIDTRLILVEVGRRGPVGSQEGMITDIVLTFAD